MTLRSAPTLDNFLSRYQARPALVLVRAMLEVHGTQQCEAMYKERWSAHEAGNVKIIASCGRMQGPAATRKAVAEPGIFTRSG